MYEDFFFALRNWIFSTRRIFEQREFLKSSISWKGRVTPSPRSPLFSVLFSSLKNGVRKTRPFLEGKIKKPQKKFSKIFIVPNRPKYHTNQLYTYKGYVDSVGFTEKRQKLSKWHISLIFYLF